MMLTTKSHAIQCLPSTFSNGDKPLKGVVPGWSEYVKPYAEENKFWSSVWRSAGKPRHGPYYDIMKKAKNQYSYAVRRLKRCNDIIQNDKFLDSISSGSTNIFDEIRKYRGSQINLSSRIDEHVGSANIAGHFASIYSKLYNRVDNSKSLDLIANKIETGIKNQCGSRQIS